MEIEFIPVEQKALSMIRVYPSLLRQAFVFTILSCWCLELPTPIPKYVGFIVVTTFNYAEPDVLNS